MNPNPELASALAQTRVWAPIQPHPKQIRALVADTDRLLYGGAAGGGKSAALLLAGLQHVHDPRHAALLVRNELTDMRLSGGLIALAHEWADRMRWRDQGVRWVTQDSTWVWPNGARLTFGYAAGGAYRRYLGSDWSMIGVDEAVELPEEAIRELWSRLRRNVPFQRRLLLASNPGGRSHQFLVDKFVTPGHLLSSFAHDNPGLNADEYLKLLADSQTSNRYAQLALGSWEATSDPDAYWHTDVYRYRDPTTVDAVLTVVAVDPTVGRGAGDECGIIAGVLHTDGTVTVTDDDSGKGNPDEWGERVVRLADRVGASRIIVEGDQGGEVHRSTLQLAAQRVGVGLPPVKVLWTAKWGKGRSDKTSRAQWAAGEYHRVFHADALRGGLLEVQQLSWVPGRSGVSPDRVDALGWLLFEMFGGASRRAVSSGPGVPPRVR